MARREMVDGEGEQELALSLEPAGEVTGWWEEDKHCVLSRPSE